MHCKARERTEGVLESLKRLSVGVGYMNGYNEFVWKGLSTHSFNFGYTRNL